MKKLTEIAVRLRVISTSLLAILGFISLGLVVGFWLGSRHFAGQRIGSESGSARHAANATDPPAIQKWCDASHRVPLIPANQCGGGDSCDRAFLMAGNYPKDWNAFCAQIQAKGYAD
jgi:hypothetical protein